MKAHAGHVIASALLQTYLGEQTGRRVHAGAIERGSVESLHAVLWFADIRGFTPTSDTSPGPVVIELLNSVFEIIAATLRSRGGEVLKFLGDGVLATLSFKEADRARTCQNALDAAAETMRKLEMLNATRAASGVPTVTVDIALHIGEVLYGNVGATDRLDFTVIAQPSTKSRALKRCAAPHSTVLVSAEFVAALGNAGDRLVSLGRHRLRGIREAKEIFAPAPSFDIMNQKIFSVPGARTVRRKLFTFGVTDRHDGAQTLVCRTSSSGYSSRSHRCGIRRARRRKIFFARSSESTGVLSRAEAPVSVFEKRDFTGRD